MQKLIAFEQVSLDGYFADAKGGLDWAHTNKDDKEWNEFVAGNAGAGGTLLFGRITYEMMIQYWPTPLARKNDPEVAEGMNSMPKVVFSKTLAKAEWSNTTVVKSDLPGAVRKMKSEPGKGIAVLGSGSIVSQLAREGLIDEIQLVVNPILLGDGKKLFIGLNGHIPLEHLSTRTFGNGNVLLTYGAA